MKDYIVYLMYFRRISYLDVSYKLLLETTGYSDDEARELLELAREEYLPDVVWRPNKHYPSVREFETVGGIRRYFIQLTCSDGELAQHAYYSIIGLIAKQLAGLPQHAPVQVVRML